LKVDKCVKVGCMRKQNQGYWIPGRSVAILSHFICYYVTHGPENIYFDVQGCMKYWLQ